MSLPSGVPAPMLARGGPGLAPFDFNSLAGRYIVLLFLPEPGPARDAALATVLRRDFSLDHTMVFAISPGPTGSEAPIEADDRLTWFDDHDGRLHRLYRAVDRQGAAAPQWVVIDPSLRTLLTAPLNAGEMILDQLRGLGAPAEHAGVPLVAPVLIVPRILEPDFCRRLIDLYDTAGGTASGVMRQVGDKTIGVVDDFKRRRDCRIVDETLRASLRERLGHRLLPEITKAFQFKATRIERYIVACYDAEDGGYFMPHRDNTTAGTAHRRFAVSINLNAEDYEGGDLRFPEFGPATYRPPTGGAVVFSCSLLHEATPVTKGRRYATLPFLYDEEGQRLREQTHHTVA